MMHAPLRTTIHQKANEQTTMCFYYECCSNCGLFYTTIYSLIVGGGLLPLFVCIEGNVCAGSACCLYNLVLHEPF